MVGKGANKFVTPIRTAPWWRKAAAEPVIESGRIDRFSPLVEPGLDDKNTFTKATWR